MTIVYGPFASGAGATFSETQWLSVFGVTRTGILYGQRNQFAVFADSTGMNVKVPSGTAVLQGFVCDSDAQELLTITAANPTNPRIDRVMVRRNFTAKTVSLVVVAGSPAASPSPPAPQRDTSIWDLSLARVAVGAAASTIAAGAITDERYDPNVSGLIHPFMGAILCRSTSRPTGVPPGTVIMEVDTDILSYMDSDLSTWNPLLLGGGTLSAMTLVDPRFTTQGGRVSTNQTLPPVGTSTGKVRYYKALAALSVTKDASDGSVVWGPGATAGSTSVVMGTGDSIWMFCDGATWTVY